MLPSQGTLHVLVSQNLLQVRRCVGTWKWHNNATRIWVLCRFKADARHPRLEIFNALEQETFQQILLASFTHTYTHISLQHLSSCSTAKVFWREVTDFIFFSDSGITKGSCCFLDRRTASLLLRRFHISTFWTNLFRFKIIFVNPKTFESIQVILRYKMNDSKCGGVVNGWFSEVQWYKAWLCWKD